MDMPLVFGAPDEDMLRSCELAHTSAGYADPRPPVLSHPRAPLGTTQHLMACSPQQTTSCSFSNVTQLRAPALGRTQSTPTAGPTTVSATSSYESSSHALQRSLTTPNYQLVPQIYAQQNPLYYSDLGFNFPTHQSVSSGTFSTNSGMVEYTPAFYASDLVEPSSSSCSIPLSQSAESLPVQLTPDMQWSASLDGSISPTSSPTVATPDAYVGNMMSRRDSFHPKPEDDLMLAYQLGFSDMPILSEEGELSFPFDFDSKSINNHADGTFFDAFTGFPGESRVFPFVSASAHPLAFPPDEQPCLAKDMWRSASAPSSEGKTNETSMSVLPSRQSRRGREVNAQAASRKIAPKAILGRHEIGFVPSDVGTTDIESSDGLFKPSGVLSKTLQTRSQQMKIKCDRCNERKEGFRGTHELERHIARAHAPKRKVYICVDASKDKTFLAHCKHCRAMKHYGAYYNAAAHLRRTHFHPRKKGKKSKNDERRGGIGGGDDPPMDWLKRHWIREVEVDNIPSKPANHRVVVDESIEKTHQTTCSPINQQIATDPEQYMDFSMVKGTTFAGHELNTAVPNEHLNFEFDAYA